MRATTTKHCARILIATLVSTVVPLAAQSSGKRGSAPSGSLDEGLLDPSWFGAELAFVETDEIDYFWVAEGFELRGRTIQWQDWPEPTEFLGEDGAGRDENDFRLARQMANEMARSFADIFNRELGGAFPSSREEGEILAEGRIVDCSTGNRAAKALVGFGAGAGKTAIDVRFTDKATGELVMAIHHRVVSGTSWSTTDSKFFKWVKKMGKEMAEDGVQELYDDGELRKN
ncbi:MAG TPA: DUF4410 domain-containing protein [Thermoanaerobaculia bacterium]|nr:DUF4410 domain-containing protein [Thermoanaerobaculia bacterium]